MYDGAELNIIHIFGIVQKSSLGVECFFGGGGTEVTIFWASRFCQSSNRGLPRFCQNLKGINNHHQSHIWDCSRIITGGGKLGGGCTKILPFCERGVASRFCQYSNMVLPRFCLNLKRETQISPMQTLFSAILIL